MQLQVKGRNLPVTDALFDHAERKLGRLARIFPGDATRVELELSVERNPKIERSQIAEITVRTKGPLLRAREGADDMYVAIDGATRKLERQAGRYRSRRRDLHRGERARSDAVEEVAEAALLAEAEAVKGETADEPAPRLVKEKRFQMQPMEPGDAALHMDLVDHDFYVFRNAQSGVVNVVYRRRDGDYGLIVPDE